MRRFEIFRPDVNAAESSASVPEPEPELTAEGQGDGAGVRVPTEEAEDDDKDGLDELEKSDQSGGGGTPLGYGAERRTARVRASFFVADLAGDNFRRKAVDPC